MFLFGLVAGICFYYVAPKLRLLTNYKKKKNWMGQKTEKVSNLGAQKKNPRVLEKHRRCV